MNIIRIFRFLLAVIAGWINRHQQDIIDYLIEGIVFSSNSSMVVVCNYRMMIADDWP